MNESDIENAALESEVGDAVPDTTKHIALEKAVEYWRDRGESVMGGAPMREGFRIIETARQFEMWLRSPNQSIEVIVGPNQ